LLGADGAKPRSGARIGFRLIALLLLFFALFALFYYRASLTGLNQRLGQTPTQGQVSLRGLPYPFRAALGLTLSPDKGLTLDQYVGALRRLVSSPLDEQGQGLGLDVGGSVFFYPPGPDWTAYLNPPGPEGRENRRIYNSLIRAGIIDVLDSYGQDVRFSREMAEHALKALSEQGLTLSTWADRFKSPDNIDSSGGRGSHPSRMAYHLDLTVEAGLKYFWLGRDTPLVGQEVPFDWDTFLSLYDSRMFFRSSLGMLMVFGRHLAMVMAWSSNDALRDNLLLAPIEFSNGLKGYEYIRYRPLGGGESPASVLNARFLERLTAVNGRSIVNIKLKPSPEGDLFQEDDLDALEELAGKRNRGEILVTSASRLLDLTALSRSLVWRVEEGGERLKIVIEKIEDPLTGPREPRLEELAGLTFYVPESMNAGVFIGGKELRVKRNLIDHTGRESISLPWPKVGFPDLDRQDN
jgi:hypothetical protein